MGRRRSENGQPCIAVHRPPSLTTCLPWTLARLASRLAVHSGPAADQRARPACYPPPRLLLQWHDLICTPAGVEGNPGSTPEDQAVADGIGELKGGCARLSGGLRCRRGAAAAHLPVAPVQAPSWQSLLRHTAGVALHNSMEFVIGTLPTVTQVCNVEQNTAPFASNWVPMWAGAVEAGSPQVQFGGPWPAWCPTVCSLGWRLLRGSVGNLPLQQHACNECGCACWLNTPSPWPASLAGPGGRRSAEQLRPAGSGRRGHVSDRVW